MILNEVHKLPVLQESLLPLWYLFILIGVHADELVYRSPVPFPLLSLPLAPEPQGLCLFPSSLSLDLGSLLIHLLDDVLSVSVGEARGASTFAFGISVAVAAGY